MKRDSKKTYGVILLAGGRSERMKFPKAFLEYRGQTFLKRLVDLYESAGVKDICVVVNHTLFRGQWYDRVKEVAARANIVRNSDPGLGRTHSIKLGAMQMKHVHACFIHNIDSPLVTRDVVNRMISAETEKGYVSPVFDGVSGHPVLISRGVVHGICSLQDTDTSLRKILSDYKRNKVEVKEANILFNINTLQDYQKYVLNVQ